MMILQLAQGYTASKQLYFEYGDWTPEPILE